MHECFLVCVCCSPCTICLDGLDANLGIVGEEDEHLVRRVVVVGHQNNQVTRGNG